MGHPLAAFPLAKTCDADEAQSVLSREMSDLKFKSVRDRGGLKFEMNGIHLGRTMVAFNQFSTKSEVDAGVIENAVIVSLSVGAPAVLDLDGELVGPNRLGIVSPSRRLTVHRAPESGVLVLRAGFEAVAERFRELTGKELTTPIVFNRSVDLDRGVDAQIRRILSYLVEDAANTDTILNSPLLRTGLVDMLLGAVLALPNNHSDILRGECRIQLAPPVVRRAEEFMEAHAAKPIAISDVVRECGCSRTALFSAFRRHRGYTPLQFFEETRLTSAREALLRSTPTDTVTSVALACGFLHLGRFAEAYRKRFGEKPSETRRKS